MSAEGPDLDKGCLQLEIHHYNNVRKLDAVMLFVGDYLSDTLKIPLLTVPVG